MVNWTQIQDLFKKFELFFILTMKINLNFKGGVGPDFQIGTWMLVLFSFLVFI